MAQYLIKDTTMKNIADNVRALTGTNGSLSPAQLSTEIQTAKENVDSAMAALEALGVTIPEGSNIGDLAGLVGSVESGISLPTLANEGTAADLLAGKQLIDQEGNIVEGTIDTKTASNLTASGATVTVPAGYYATQATKTISSGSAKTPATTVTKAPIISVNSSGLITASVSGTQSVTPTVSAGYVSSGTAGTITVSGSATKQLTTQVAKTITPTKSSQTAVASGRYTTGAVTVAAIPSEYVTTTDATASAADMRLNATAYVNGSKVTGAIEDFDGSYECSGDSTGGESGGSVETCTVTIGGNSYFVTVYCLVLQENGTWSATSVNAHIYSDTVLTIENVVKNSLVAISSTTIGSIACTHCVEQVTIDHLTVVLVGTTGNDARINLYT